MAHVMRGSRHIQLDELDGEEANDYHSATKERQEW